MKVLTQGVLQFGRDISLNYLFILIFSLMFLVVQAVLVVKLSIDQKIDDLVTRSDFVIAVKDDFDAFTLDSLINEMNQIENYDVRVTPLESESIGLLDLPQRIQLQFGTVESILPSLNILKSDRYQNIFASWERGAEAEFINFVTRLESFYDLANKISFWILFFLAIVMGYLIHFQTLLMIQRRKKELKVAQMVGARWNWLMVPIFIEILLIGLLGLLISMAIITVVMTQIKFIDLGPVFLTLFNHYWFLMMLLLFAALLFIVPLVVRRQL